MFISVKYADNRTLLFNPNCLSVILLRCIKERCGYPGEVAVDLADEQGWVKNLSSHLDEYADKFLTARASYVLVKMEKGEDGELMYTPLLDGSSKFMARLPGHAANSKRTTSRLNLVGDNSDLGASTKASDVGKINRRKSTTTVTPQKSGGSPNRTNSGSKHRKDAARSSKKSSAGDAA
eukprot:Opistho-1_new@64388